MVTKLKAVGAAGVVGGGVAGLEVLHGPALVVCLVLVSTAVVVAAIVVLLAAFGLHLGKGQWLEVIRLWLTRRADPANDP